MRTRTIAFVAVGLLATALVLGILGPGLAQPQTQWGPGGWGPGGMMGGPGMMGPGMMWGYGAPAGSGGWLWGLPAALGWLATLTFGGGLIAAVVLLVRSLSSATGGSGSGAEESALDILKRHYAAGEISEAEYEQAKRALA